MVMGRFTSPLQLNIIISLLTMPTATGRAFTTANFLTNLAALKAINFGASDPLGTWFVVPNQTTNNVEIWVWEPASTATTNEIDVIRPDSIISNAPGRCIQRLKFSASSLGGVLAAIAALNTTGLIERTAGGGAAIVPLNNYIRSFLDDVDAAAARTTLGLGNLTNHLQVNTTESQTVAGEKTFTGVTRITNTTTSTSTTTGALIVSGGIGADHIKVKNAWLLEARSGGVVAQDLNTQVYGQFAATRWLDGGVTNTNTPVGANAGMLLQFDPLFGVGGLEAKYRVQEFITGNRWWKRMESNAAWQPWYELAFLNKAQTFTSIQNFTTQINIDGIKVAGARNTGWTTATGTPNKGTFAADTATLIQVAQRLLALEQAMAGHGLIGA